MGHVPRKSLGQHFLDDKRIARRIVEAASLEAGEVLLEIGAGKGILTQRVLEAFPSGEITFGVVEKDHRLITLLEGMASGDWFRVYEADILRFDLSKFDSGDKKIKVLGNIPYNITSEILFLLVAWRARLSVAVLTVQKEVAERVVAAPGSKAYGRLSVMLQFYLKPSMLFEIAPAAFVPKPRVHSAVLKLVFSGGEGGKADVDERLFSKLVKIGFSARRKKLFNNLRAIFYEREDVLESCFDKANVSRNARAEELSVASFIKLTQNISLQTERE